MTTDTMKPPVTSVGVLGWLRKNLFSTWYNSLFTVVFLWLTYVVLRGVLDWTLTEARWGVVATNLRLFMVGQFPADQTWRVWLCVVMVSLLSGLSWGAWGGMARSMAVALMAGLTTLVVLPFVGDKPWLLANIAAALVGFGVGRRWPGKRRWIVAGWLLSFPISIIFVRGIGDAVGLPVVGTNLWGGLLLTFILAIVGITVSFPIGVLLALGRTSDLPAIRVFSVLYIELVRGVPLVTILFMAQIMLPLFLPEDLRIDRVVRAMAGLTLFSAAYLAENVRGGLQSVPRGQVEAARAVGLNGLQTMALIVLPQALRAVIPPIVGQFISLFKDTSLVAIVGLLELLNIGRSVLAQPEWLGTQREVFLFVAVVYWIFSYGMSYASRRLEATLGVGER